MSDEQTFFQFPAAVLTRTSDAALLELATQRAVDPAIFEEFPPYFWAARASTDRLDAYFSWMMRSTLHNFAEEATAGIAFQDSHKTDGIVRTLGQSLTGKDVGPGGNGVAHMDADFYTLTGLDPAIDSFIRKMRGGLVRDVSVGFYGGKWICSVCGRDMMSDWDCWHWPGTMTYPLDKNGEPDRSKEKVLVTAGIDDAHLAEVSIVYDGATPGAMILRAQRDIEAGRLKPEQVRLLEVQYRTKLPGASHSTPGHDIEEKRMPPEATVTIRIEDLPPEQVRSLFDPIGITADTLVDGIRQLAERDAKRETELGELRPLADDGRSYRKARVDRAMQEYVRFCGAMGKTITEDDQAAKRMLLERSPIADVDLYGDDWEERATAKLGGGRQTVDTSEKDDKPATPERKVPDAAFKTGRA